MLWTNLRNQVRQTPLPKWKPLILLFEAVLQNLRNQSHRRLLAVADPTRRWIRAIGLAVAVRLAHFQAAAFGAAVSGVGGTLGFKLFHGSTAPSFTIWQHWFASDALGIVTVAPLLIGLAAAVRDPPPQSEVIEGTVALVAITGMSMLVIF